MITIKKKQIEQLSRQLKKHLPDVSCGAIIGYSNGNNKIVSYFVELENEISENRRSRYLITPERYLYAEETALTYNLELLGFYYLSGNKSEKPSEFDKNYALPGVLYLSASVEEDCKLNTRFFNLNNNRKEFEELQVRIIDDKITEEKRYAIAV